MERLELGVNFKPFNKDILLQLPVISDLTPFGVVKSKQMIEDEMKNMDKFLPVLAVSDLVTQIKVGDSVLISHGSHPSFVEEKTTYLIVNELHVLGKRVFKPEILEVSAVSGEETKVIPLKSN